MTIGSGTKRFLLAILATAGAYAATPPKYLWPYGVHKAWPMEWFEAESVDGTTLTSEDCEGRPTLVVIWAAWCPYMPENLKVVERVKMRYRSTEACVVPVSIDKEKNTAWEFARAQQLVEPYYWGYDGLSEMYWGHTIPHAFVFDRMGRLILSRDTLAGDYDAVMAAMDAVVHDGSSTGSPSPTAPGHTPKPAPEKVEEEQIAEQVRALFKAGDIDRIEDLARYWREQRAKTALGVWKEKILLNQLVVDPDFESATDEDFQRRIAYLDDWISKRPGSAIARTALGRQWLIYAWQARGHGETGEVASDAWRPFKERLQNARNIFEQADALPLKSPVLYDWMIGLARAQEWPEPDREALFAKAVAYEPSYLPYYFAHAVGLEPRWYGNHAVLRRFVERSADGIKDGKGDELYTLMIWELNEHLEEDGVNPFKTGYSWPRALAGCRSLIAQDPGPARREECAKLAVLAGDQAVARELFAAEGVRYESWAWGSRDAFLKARRWARRETLWKRMAAWIGFGGIA